MLAPRWEDEKGPRPMPEHQHVPQVGEKCSVCGESDVSPAAPSPEMMATSWAEFDALRAASEQEVAAMTLMSVFNLLTSNINNSGLSPVEKANAISAAAQELASRLGAQAVGSEPDPMPDDMQQTEDDAIAAGLASMPDAPITTDPGSMSVFKDAQGNWRWVAIHSNKFEDRQREIFPMSAHKAFVDNTWRTGQFPALRLWHVPVDVGVADFVDLDTNGFVLSSGKFYPEHERAAERLAGMKDLGCSHGFLYRKEDLQGGVYKAYRTYEVSVLPRMKAANTLTAFFAGEEIPMLTADRKAFLVDVMGEERVDGIESGLRQLATLANENGLSYKALEETLLDARKDENAGMSHGPGGNLTSPGTGDMTDEEKAAQKKRDDEEAASAKKDDAPADDDAPPKKDDKTDEEKKAEADAAAAAEKADEPSAKTEDKNDAEDGVDKTDEEKKADAAAADAGDKGLPSALDTPSEAERATAAAAAALAGGMGMSVDGDGAKAATAVETALQRVMAPYMEDLRGIMAKQKSQEESIADLRAGRDGEIAGMIRPRVGPDTRTLERGVRSSESDDTIVGGDVKARLEKAAAVKSDDSDKGTGHTAATPYVTDMLSLMSSGRVTNG